MQDLAAVHLEAPGWEEMDWAVAGSGGPGLEASGWEVRALGWGVGGKGLEDGGANGDGLRGGRDGLGLGGAGLTRGGGGDSGARRRLSWRGDARRGLPAACTDAELVIDMRHFSKQLKLSRSPCGIAGCLHQSFRCGLS